MGRQIILAFALLGAGYFTVTRIDRVIDCVEKTNAGISQANTQLLAANRQIAEMQEKLAETSRKLEQTNLSLARTNTKIDETQTLFASLDKAFQKFPLWRR
ncbi:hypothetical protein [Paludisphaera rhizosphaerae]|uniref:hypothetical protein n=1 Tax=Paludisphaera rhizosphaerae TaxID=2711216 RepID=UPI0013ED2F86|nr:hypothetical protein [Paludisphaera rhizosphaerae]